MRSCGGCRTAKLLKLTACTKRCGYCPGERVTFTVMVENTHKISLLRIHAKLTQIINYSAKGNQNFTNGYLQSVYLTIIVLHKNAYVNIRGISN